MNKILALALACLLTAVAEAQTPAVPLIQAFGKIDNADLELKQCDFEKDANAMVLFDKGEVFFDQSYNVVTNRHRRIKIFNDNGKDEANIRIEYYSGNHLEYIGGLQAQTINLTNGTAEIIKVDKKQIFTERVDDDHSALVFSFPNVKPGSVIEYKYTLTSQDVEDFPDWYFQSDLPTRISQLNTNVPDILYYKSLESRYQPYAIDKTDNSGTHIRAIVNIPSIPDEPFMTSREDNSERLLFQLLSIRAGTFSKNFLDSWKKVGENMVNSDNLGGQLRKKLLGEEVMIAKAKAMKSDDEKIAYLFSEVRNAMKWDGSNHFTSGDGIAKAWEKKVGNSGEINLMVCHLLRKAGVKSYPLIVSTRGHGKINPGYPSYYKFNSLVAYVPVDTTRLYVLDASNKYNVYNQIPSSLLNNFALSLNDDDAVYDVKFLQNESPVRQVVMINADVKPDSKITGTASITNYGYKRINAVERYKTDGEKKYFDYLRDADNNLKITAVKFENMDVDTLPLTQNVDFSLNLTSSDDNYIYVTPNILSSLKANPFINDSRYSDIDMGYRSNYMIIGNYKLPAGYKIESLPKSTSMTMPDGSITFKRVLGEQDGAVMVRYTVDHKKSIFFKEDYAELHEFFKKMYEMLNEQIVLKKG